MRALPDLNTSGARVFRRGSLLISGTPPTRAGSDRPR
jgi:hypothetical protein